MMTVNKDWDGGRGRRDRRRWRESACFVQPESVARNLVLSCTMALWWRRRERAARA
jgi:hypothetical protein